MENLIWHNEKRIIKDLIPTEGNPRKMTVKEAEDLKESLTKFNLADIPVINLDNRIVSGHQRVNILKSLGREDEEIDVRVPNRLLSEEEHREYLLRANKNLGEWDLGALSDFSEELLKDIGWESEELDKIFNSNPNLEDDDFDLETEAKKITEPKVKLGDLYEIDGIHKFLCWDSRDPKGFEFLVGDKNIDMVFSSPPYNEGGSLYKDYADNLKSEDFIQLHLDVLNNCKKFLKGFIFWNVSYNKNAKRDFIKILYKIVEDVKLEFLEMIVWDKKTATPVVSKEGLTRQYEDILLLGDENSVRQDLEVYFCGRNGKAYFNKKTQKGISNLWRIGTNSSQFKNHKACFPIALPIKGIELMTQRGNIVCDPMFGVGTCAVACLRTGRIFYGIELSPLYLEMTLNRIKFLFGKEATLVGNINELQKGPQEQPMGSQQIN